MFYKNRCSYKFCKIDRMSASMKNLQNILRITIKTIALPQNSGFG